MLLIWVESQTSFRIQNSVYKMYIIWNLTYNFRKFMNPRSSSINPLEFSRSSWLRICAYTHGSQSFQLGNPFAVSDCKKIHHPWTQWDLKEKVPGSRKKSYLKMSSRPSSLSFRHHTFCIIFLVLLEMELLHQRAQVFFEVCI